MIFSTKIYKLDDGEKATLYADSANNMQLYYLNGTLKKCNIILNQNKKCVLVSEFNYNKIIKLNQNTFCPCTNGYVTIINE